MSTIPVYINPYTFAYDSTGKIWYGNATATADPSWPSTLSTVTFDDTSTPTGATIFGNTSLYTINEGVATEVSNSAAILLSQAQSQQVALLQQSAQVAFAAGFTSAASGTSLQYGFQPGDQANMNELASMSALGAATWPVNWQLPSGQIVSLTQAQFTTLLTDAQSFKWSVLEQLRTLIGQVMAATTISSAQSVVWP